MLCREAGSGRCIGRSVMQLIGKLCGKRDGRKAEKDSDQNPEIGVHQKVLIERDAVIAHREKDQEGEPEDHEGDGKPGRAAQLFGDPPSRNGDRGTENDPKNQSHNAHFNNQLTVTAFHGNASIGSVQDARDILNAEGSSASAVAVHPARSVEGGEEILERIIASTVGKFASAAIRT